MDAFFASDFWPDDFWPEGFFGDPALGVVPYTGFWTPNFWLDTFWPEAFWANDPESTSAGTIAVTLSSVTAAMTGDYNPAAAGPRTGILNAELGGVTASVAGTIAYITDFDLEVGVSTNWTLSDLPVLDGAISVTLDDLTSSIVGSAWEFSFTDGYIGPAETLWAPMFWDWRLFPDGYWPKTSSFEDLTASLAGTFSETPANRAGFISTTLEALAASLQGRFTPREQFNGTIAVTLDGLTSALAGTSERPVFTGAVAVTFDGVTAYGFGLFTPAGSRNGRIQSTLTGVAGQFRGTYDVPLRTGTIAPTLDGVTGYAWGLSLPVGAKLGRVVTVLSGVNMVGSGTFVTPRMRPKESVVTVTEIDWKTLCDQHNLGREDEYSYEFSNGRRFKQA